MAWPSVCDRPGADRVPGAVHRRLGRPAHGLTQGGGVGGGFDLTTEITEGTEMKNGGVDEVRWPMEPNEAVKRAAEAAARKMDRDGLFVGYESDSAINGAADNSNRYPAPVGFASSSS